MSRQNTGMNYMKKCQVVSRLYRAKDKRHRLAEHLLNM